MSHTAADLMIDTLIEWDVEVIFGIPGDGINGIIEALRKRQDKIRFIQTRHEESAAFMATAYSKWTGRLGVCLATSGPGGIHLLNGLYDAKLDGASVLAITGLQYHDLLGTLTQQDVALDKLFMDVAVYNERVMGPAHVRNVVDLACRTALAYRGVSHVTIPVDIQSMDTSKSQRSPRNVKGHLAAMMSRGGQAPADEHLLDAANILNKAKRPLILAGRGALGAREPLLEVAEKLGAPIAMPLLGKGAAPDDHPHSVGGVGLLGAKPAQEALEDCDTLLIVGSSFPYIEFYPEPGQAPAVQVEIDPKRIGLRYPIDAALVGDARIVLERLSPLLKRNENRDFLEHAQAGMKDWRALLEERGTVMDTPMKPQAITHALNGLIDDDAIIATDSGTITTWTARYIDIKADRKFACSGNLATMACGLPYAIAAAVAFPDRQVVAVVGDGALSMLMGELVTLKKYDFNVKIVVIKNNSLGQIKWEQMVFLGNPEYVCELEPIDFALVAEGCHIKAVTIDSAVAAASTLKDVLAEPGPCLVEAVVDPHEPPMPPMIKPKQALHLAQSLAKGTPDRGKIAATIAKDKIRELV